MSALGIANPVWRVIEWPRLNPSGLCACGCGQRTNLATQDRPSAGWVKGEPIKYLRGHAKTARRGEGSPSWKGGRRLNGDGYVLVLLPPEHWLRCMGDSYGYAPEHRLMMAEHLGRPLVRGEIVHHRNETRDDNRLENLQLTTMGEHRRIHADLSTHCRYGHPWDAGNTYHPPDGSPRSCRACAREHQRKRRQ